ncbi:MAG TPA: winged helix-turn-helix transcriptional regulator [Sulfolobales archaeon]|nr:winged helix-turn-helix transcriptional regulator [Sulfolobales archaeon]
MISGDGTIDAFLTIYMDPSSDSITSIDLPIQPIPGSISVSPVDVVIQPLPNNTIAILKPRGISKIDISYIGSINVSDGIIMASIKYPQWADNLTIRVHRNIVLISVPTNITSFSIFGEYVIIGLAKGSRWDLEYTVAQSTPGTVSSVETPVTGGTRAVTATQITAPAASVPILAAPLLLVGLIVGAGLIASLIIFIRRHRSEGPEYLDSTDREILRVIEKLGEASARDIMSHTNLPKTTLYRRLNKMISMGIIGTRAKSGITYYYILRKPEQQ